MSDPLVQKWKQTGAVSVWRYRSVGRDGSGWHLRAGVPGRESLLDLLDRMRRAEWPCQAQVVVTKPSEIDLRVPNFIGKATSPTTLTIEYPKADVVERFWNLTAKPPELHLTIGAAKIEELMGVLKDPRLAFDTRIGPDSGPDTPDEHWIWLWCEP